MRENKCWIRVSLCCCYHILHCCSEAGGPHQADTRILVWMRCHPCQGGGGHWALQGAGEDICWAINSHLSFSWEKLRAGVRVGCRVQDKSFRFWKNKESWVECDAPTPDTALDCCPWSRTIHQLLSNSPDIVLQCSLAANTEGKQIIISLWYLLS